MVFGNKLSAEEKAEFKEKLITEPRRFIAQEVIDFLDIDIMEKGEILPRKADLRAFVLMSQ
ncbi:Circularly permuted ATP-grasp type 2 [Lachnospiraceae bacterium]|nr:Circularly permuted ATP-grasp type 2 [Lachnospiraceae bacterium]